MWKTIPFLPTTFCLTLNLIQSRLFSACVNTKVNNLIWRELFPQVRGSWKVSVTWPPLSSGLHNLWLIAAPHIWSSWKGRAIHSSIFPHNQGFTKEEKESADAGELSSWISGSVFFPSLYPPVDSLSDSYKTYPSLTSVRLSLNWLEISSPLIDLEKQTKSFQHIHFKSELFNFG